MLHNPATGSSRTLQGLACVSKLVNIKIPSVSGVQCFSTSSSCWFFSFLRGSSCWCVGLLDFGWVVSIRVQVPREFPPSAKHQVQWLPEGLWLLKGCCVQHSHQKQVRTGLMSTRETSEQERKPAPKLANYIRCQSRVTLAPTCFCKWDFGS